MSSNQQQLHPKAVTSSKNGFHQLATLVLLLMLALVSFSGQVECLEQDAQILTPVAGLAKSIIKTATLGSPLQLDFGTMDLVKNFAYFTWRTGFPVKMPRGFFEKVQDFYNRVRTRVDETEVKNLERKSLVNLKLDLDNIVDSIVNQVRQSSDGLYTNYLDTLVDGLPLEDACVAVGVQLKAYGVDLTNYRNIAGAVLGVPLMPQVASTVIGVASLAPRLGGSAVNLTSNLYNAPVNQLPGAALTAFSQMSDSAMQNLRKSISSPLSLFGGGQAPAFAPSTALMEPALA